MELEPNHPFEVLILQDTPSEGVTSFAINSGKIFNFYNPLNYRNVQCNSNGPPLPSLPYSIKNSTREEQEESIFQTSFVIDSTTFRIEIFLFCCFKPPENWVAGPSYIPMIDKTWVVFKNYSDPDDKSKFTIKGNVRNLTESNIKLNYYDANDKQDDSEKESGVFEEEIDWVDNAVNLGPIALLKKTNEVWSVTQFLKENYPFTDFFDSKTFELCNTQKYNLNNKQVLKKEQLNLRKAIEENIDKVVYILGSPGTDTLKGYIRWKDYAGSSKFLLKFPFESTHLEVINSRQYNNIL